MSARGIRLHRLATRFVHNKCTEVLLITKIALGLGYLVGVLAACCTLGFAAETFHPLDVKTGEWEASVNVAMNGAPPIPAEALARMTPEQRARLEEQTKSLSGRTIVHKSCVKKEKLDQPLTF